MQAFKIGFALLALSFAAHSQVAGADFIDEFNSLDPSHWDVVGGSWSTDAGILSGSWSIYAAQTDQGNLLSRDVSENQDFHAEFQTGTTGYPGQRFVLYNSPGNKYNVVFQPFGLDPDRVGVFVELRSNGADYTHVLDWTQYDFDCTGAGGCTFGLEKAGSHYSMFINGTPAGEFTDNVWSGNTRLGLGAYAEPVTYDRFTLDAGQIPEPGTLALFAVGLTGLGAETRRRKASSGKQTTRTI